MWKRTILIIAACLLLAACGGSDTGDQAEESSIGDARQGRQIFETGGASGVPCNSCHTLDGTELVGPSLQGIADRAGTRVEGLNAEEYLRQSITEPNAHVVEGYAEGTMPNTYADTLSEEDVNNVIAYLFEETGQ